MSLEMRTECERCASWISPARIAAGSWWTDLRDRRGAKIEAHPDSR